MQWVRLVFTGLCCPLQGDRVKELKDSGRPKTEVQEAVAQLKVRKKHLEAKVRVRRCGQVMRLGEVVRS